MRRSNSPLLVYRTPNPQLKNPSNFSSSDYSLRFDTSPPESEIMLMGATRSAPPLRTRHGVTSVLAMMYITLFALLAVGFYASTNTNTQASQNQQRRCKS